MTENLSDEVHRVFELASEEARLLRHNFVSTEHLLIGLIRAGGIAQLVLSGMGIYEENVRSRAAAIIGIGTDVAPLNLGQTPRFKQILREMRREADLMGDDLVSSEHILLALVELQEGVAAHILRDLEVDPEAVRTEIALIRKSP